LVYALDRGAGTGYGFNIGSGNGIPFSKLEWLPAEGKWMGMDGSARAAGARLNSFGRIRAGVLASALLGFCVAGCSTVPQAPVAAVPTHGPTVAFDSIDGPPQSIFNRLVQDLGDEAIARQMAVVSRQGPAQYRVRGYLAALVEGKRRTTMISWVWDVYDANQQRAVRISGEEPASGSGRGTWAAADDGVLQRIATASMDQLAAFLAAPDAQPAPPVVPVTSGPNVAADNAARSSPLAYAGERR